MRHTALTCYRVPAKAFYTPRADTPIKIPRSQLITAAPVHLLISLCSEKSIFFKEGTFLFLVQKEKPPTQTIAPFDSGREATAQRLPYETRDLGRYLVSIAHLS